MSTVDTFVDLQCTQWACNKFCVLSLVFCFVASFTCSADTDSAAEFSTRVLIVVADNNLHMDWTFSIPVVEYESCYNNTFSLCNMVCFYAIGALLISFRSCIPPDCWLCFCPHISPIITFFSWHIPAFSLVFHFVPFLFLFSLFSPCVLQVQYFVIC